jgi:hypothetical protein
LKTLIGFVLLYGSCLQLGGIVVQAPTLSNITVTGGQHSVRVAITATAPIIPHIETVTEPDRLIVDLPDVLPREGLRKILVNRGKLKDIRVGLLSTDPRITRVVLDLFEPIQYRLRPFRNSIVVHLGELAGFQPAPIEATTELPGETRSGETLPMVVTPPPAAQFFTPKPSRARWILPILTMSTVFAMLVIAFVSHIQNKRMRRGL